MKYIVYNASGEITRKGSCPDEVAHLQVREGEFMLEGDADLSKDSVDVAAKVVIPGGKPPPPPPPLPTYADKRREAYPSMRDQLDMLWHSMDQQQIQKSEPFYSQIKAVKEAYPKTPPA